MPAELAAAEAAAGKPEEVSSLDDQLRLEVPAPADSAIVVTRRFDAPRPVVFAALTRPERLRRWRGARGWPVVECEVELRVNGAWWVLSRGPQGELRAQRGVYREIVPGHRLVYVETYDDPRLAGECRVTVGLDDVGGGTALTNILRLPYRPARDQPLRSSMEISIGEGFDRLAALLDLVAVERK